MTRLLAKLLDAIWYLAMGLFLGLTGGLVLSVILTFRGAREIDASPGVEPFNDPIFADYHNDAVAGHIGQDLFMVGGTVALVLLGVAILSRALQAIVVFKFSHTLVGTKLLSAIQLLFICICLGLMLRAASFTSSMNDLWPKIYEPETSEKMREARRAIFDKKHAQSEQAASIAWLSGLLALSISPWCRRVADTPKNTESEGK